jgi:hypothetical protein
MILSLVRVGPGAQSAIIHLSNLFPAWKSTMTAVITGSFQLSFVVFLVFDELWFFKQFSYRSLFLGYVAVCIFNVIISFFLWPDEPYHFEEQLATLIEDEGGDEEQVCRSCLFSCPLRFLHCSMEWKLDIFVYRLSLFIIRKLLPDHHCRPLKNKLL